MLVLRAFRALPGVFCFFPDARQLALAKDQLGSQPCQFRLHLAVPVLRGNHFAFHVALLRPGFFQRLFRRAKFCCYLSERGQLPVHLVFELQYLGTQRAQFALHA